MLHAESVKRSAHRREIAIGIITLLLILLLVSCQAGPSSRVSVRHVGGAGENSYSRIDISPDYLSDGLRYLFNQLSQRCGPVDAEPIIKDYVGLIHQGLYHHGFCSIEKLNINGTTVDIDIYFVAQQQPAKLRMEAFLHGTSQPLAMMASEYYTDFQ